MKLTLLLILCSVFLTSAWANLPSVESLFRHGANADIATNTVKVEFEIEKLSLVDGVPNEESVPTGKVYTTVYFIKSGNDFNILQLSSTKQISEESKVGAFYYRKNFLKHLSYKKDVNLQKDIFYSTLISILLNDSSSFSYLLKKTDGKFKKNSEVMNRKKVGVLHRYKKYLQQVKDNPDSEGSLTNPISPGDAKEKLRVRDVLSSSMYMADKNLKLIKKDKEFILNLELDNYTFNFTNESHQFLNLSYKDRGEDLSMHFKKFILFNGTHQLPSKVIYKTGASEAFLISFSKLSHFNVSRAFYQKKIKTSQSLITKDLNGEVELLF